jgi:hypothetical protein
MSDKTKYLIVCSECEGKGCWKCGFDAIDGHVQGVIEISEVEAELTSLPVIIVRPPDGQESE